MSENDQSQEKTEEATPKRVEKAREDGQAPRSKELTTTAVLLSGSFGLLWFGGFLLEKMTNIGRFNFSISRESVFDTAAMLNHLGQSVYDAFIGLIPLFSILLIAAIAGPIALGGWLFSLKSLMPKMNRMDPAAGLKRMFSTKALMELAKAVGKVILILVLAVMLLQSMQDELLGLAYEDLFYAVRHSFSMAAWASIALSLVTIIIAMIDIPFQLWDNSQKLKMTMQEVKDEMKDTDGKPEVKGRIRQLQQEVANRKMMESVPDADVVITNPTHYAIAIKYKPDSMMTPIVVAKGVDQIALKIREIAAVHQVEMIQSPVLARSIFYTTKIDGEIPEGLYVAVAKVLAYVFQLRNFRRGVAQRPTFPHSIRVPDDLYYEK